MSVPSIGWLVEPVKISIELDPLHSLGEVPDEGQGGVDGVSPEAFVVPDYCYTGYARAYCRLGGRVVGRVVLTAAQTESRVWHEGLELQLQQYLHLMDPYIQSEQVSVTIPLLTADEGGWITDVPLSVPFSLTLDEAAGWADTYNGYTFGVRHMLTATLMRPWYTFNCCAHSVLWLYSTGPGHSDSSSREAVLLGGTPSLSNLPVPIDSTIPAAPMEASVLVPLCGLSSATDHMPCTQCIVSILSDHIACNSSIECTLSFRSVNVDSSSGVTLRTCTPDDPFVEVILVQLVLIKGEFSADCCMHMTTMFVHTVVGFGDTTNEELMDSTALSRGYTSRSAASGPTREQDPILEDTVLTVEIPLVYTASRDRSRHQVGQIIVTATDDAAGAAIGGIRTSLTSAQKVELAAQDSINPLGGYQLLGNAELWKSLRVDPSFHIQKLPVEEGVQMCIARDPEHSTDRVEADSSVLQNEVAVRYFLRLIVQDRNGETRFVTSREIFMYRDSPPEVVERAAIGRNNASRNLSGGGDRDGHRVSRGGIDSDVHQYSNVNAINL